MVTAGASQGLSMLSTLLFSPGDLVFVEDPTYFIALRMLREDCGLQCVAGRPVLCCYVTSPDISNCVYNAKVKVTFSHFYC